MLPPAAAQQLDDRLGRVLGEYQEMPGLSLTPAQARGCGACRSMMPTVSSGIS